MGLKKGLPGDSANGAVYQAFAPDGQPRLIQKGRSPDGTMEGWFFVGIVPGGGNAVAGWLEFPYDQYEQLGWQHDELPVIAP